MNPPPQDSVSWSLIVAAVLAVALVVTVVVALRARGAARRAEKRARAAEDRIRITEDLHRSVEERHRALKREFDLRDAEDRHMAERQVPALVQALWEGREADFPPPLGTTAAGGSSFADRREDALQQVRQAATMVAGRAEDGAKAVVSTVTRSMQALLNDTTNAIDAMLERHDDPGVLADATAIDHASNQLVRRTQIINVLTGSWPGRQRRSSPLLDVVRGGVSKIRDYDRIKITGAPSYRVVSQAVEPVVLAVAELLDNAARHSEPGSDVQVWFVQGHNGVTVMIDDSGVGLTREVREQARAQLSGDEEVRLTRMGSRPKFGFPAVGVLARRYGFRVSVDQESIYGGVRAGVFLPSALLTTLDSTPPGRRDEPAEAERPAPAEESGTGRAPQQDAPPLPTRCPRVSDDDEESGAPDPVSAGDSHEVGSEERTGGEAEGPAGVPASARTGDGAADLPAHGRPEEPLAGGSRPQAGRPAGTGPRQESVPGPRATEPARPSDDEPPRTRPDGLPQRRRRSVRPSLAEGVSPAQPPINSSRTVGAFARGIRSARERRNTDERTTDQ
ncbi:ATP-binding protein [Streptomyces sp. NBC_01497]|uniref:ATP-binding protein n=1 Tax=Streptomyces sp. NBC_01497 TaxID=2903885 RepID=UPI002E312525|nr:ATP-binding protein [Streptomyces sp. NBC_01497]